MRAARLHPGDELRIEVNADGNVVLSHDDTDVLEQFFGSMPGLSRAADLEGLRDEWER